MGYTIEIVPYNSEWPQKFQEEAGKIRDALGQEVVEIYHMGSTAVPGIKAKPIIDILVEVHDIQKIDGLNGEMVRLGYEPKGEYGIPGRRFFIKNDQRTRTHHVHIFQTGHPDIERVLGFRDYLIAHPEDAQAYGELKILLADQFREDREHYTEGKTEFVRGIDHKVREWKLERSQG